MPRTVFPDDSWHAIRFGLLEASRSYSGDMWGRDVLEPWTAANPATLAALQAAGRVEMASVALADEDLWTLYALSRLVELLTASRQPPAASPDDEPFDRVLAPAAYRQFITAIDGSFPEVAGFHPFLHEIVDVEPADDPYESPSLVAEWWPGCFLGSLLLARSGVTVRAGARHLDPVVATTSTLYWAWTRRRRPVADLSHGWGSNSQWRTHFRRDYWLGDRLAYHVDAALRPALDRLSPEPAPDVAVELVRHRCSLLVDHGPDQWVWDSHHTEPAFHLRTS
jgi:hypothetical protein